MPGLISAMQGFCVIGIVIAVGRALTFRVLFCLNFVILAGCFIGWWRSGEQEVYIQTAVPCMVLFIVGWITRIASDFYYEFKG